MRSVRKLFVRELDPQRIEEYRKAHAEIWPELVSLYRRCGIIDVSCFLDGSRLAVLLEINPRVFASTREELEAHPVEREWQAWMARLDLNGTRTDEFVEVYRQSDHPMEQADMADRDLRN